MKHAMHYANLEAECMMKAKGIMENSILLPARNTFSGVEVDPIAAAFAAKATVTVPAASAIVSFSRCASFWSGELSSVSLSAAL